MRPTLQSVGELLRLPWLSGLRATIVKLKVIVACIATTSECHNFHRRRAQSARRGESRRQYPRRQTRLEFQTQTYLHLPWFKIPAAKLNDQMTFTRVQRSSTGKKSPGRSTATELRRCACHVAKSCIVHMDAEKA